MERILREGGNGGKGICRGRKRIGVPNGGLWRRSFDGIDAKKAWEGIVLGNS